MPGDRGQRLGPDLGIMTVIITAVVLYAVYDVVLSNVSMNVDLVTAAYYAGGAVLLLLLVRGIWVLKKSGDARIERKKAAVKAREGRDPDDAMAYEQEVEAQAIAYLSKIPLIRRVVAPFRGKK